MYWPSNVAACAMIASSLTTLGSFQFNSPQTTYQYEVNFWKIVGTIRSGEASTVQVVSSPTEMTMCSSTIRMIYAARTLLCMVPIIICIVAFSVGIMVCKRGSVGLDSKYFKRFVLILLVIAAAESLAVGGLGIGYWASDTCGGTSYTSMPNASWGPSAFLAFGAFALLSADIVLQCCVKPQRQPQPSGDRGAEADAGATGDEGEGADHMGITVEGRQVEMRTMRNNSFGCRHQYAVTPNDILLPMKRLVDRWVKGIDGPPQLNLPWSIVGFLTRNYDEALLVRSVAPTNAASSSLAFDRCLVVSADTIVPIDLALQRCSSIAEAAGILARLGYAGRVSPYLAACYGASLFHAQSDDDAAWISQRLHWKVHVGEAIVAVLTEHIINTVEGGGGADAPPLGYSPREKDDGADTATAGPDGGALENRRREIAHAVCAARRIGCAPALVAVTAERVQQQTVVRACCCGATWFAELADVPPVTSVFNGLMDLLMTTSRPLLASSSDPQLDATSYRVNADGDVTLLAAELPPARPQPFAMGLASGLQHPVPLELECAACGKIDSTSTWKLMDPGTQCVDGHYVCATCTATVVGRSEGPPLLCSAVGCDKELLIAQCAM